MKIEVYILLIIFGFLFLHSETGFLKDCEDDHKDHDICSIFQNSDNIRIIKNSNLLQNILKISISNIFSIIQPKLLYYYLIKESEFNGSPHRHKDNKLIYFLSSLLI